MIPEVSYVFNYILDLQAKTYSEKAIKLDPNYLEPVYIMADILGHQQQYDKGIELCVFVI